MHVGLATLLILSFCAQSRWLGPTFKAYGSKEPIFKVTNRKVSVAKMALLGIDFFFLLKNYILQLIKPGNIMYLLHDRKYRH